MHSGHRDFRRKVSRLKDWDYSAAGYYFITICTEKHTQIFWHDTVPDVAAHSVRQLTPPGDIVQTAIINISKIYPAITVDKYVIMPNHIHMILIIDDGDHSWRTLCAATTNPNVSRIVKGLKEYVTKQIGRPIWQKSFHDRIIRNQTEYEKIWKYIDENPTRWQDDKYHP